MASDASGLRRHSGVAVIHEQLDELGPPIQALVRLSTRCTIRRCITCAPCRG